MSDDPRIGMGGIPPKLDINGNPVTHIAATAGIGDGRYVVIPPGFTDWHLLEPLRKSGSNTANAKKVAHKGKGSDEQA